MFQREFFLNEIFTNLKLNFITSTKIHICTENVYSPDEILNQKLTEPSMLSYGLKKRFPDEASQEIVGRLQGLCKRKNNVKS